MYFLYVGNKYINDTFEMLLTVTCYLPRDMHMDCLYVIVLIVLTGVFELADFTGCRGHAV